MPHCNKQGPGSRMLRCNMQRLAACAHCRHPAHMALIDDYGPADGFIPAGKAPTLAATDEPTAAHDGAVRAALYRAAVGGEQWSETLDKVGDVRVLRREVAPDVGAARKWLEARAPDQWAEKRTQEFRVIVARIEGREVEGVGLTLEHDPNAQVGR